MVGCDTGLLIGYALAADHPDRVDRLALGEAPLPGVAPTPPLFLPAPLNERLWHIPFNALPEVNEKLVSGREDIFFGEKFSNAAGKKKLSPTPSSPTSTSSRPTRRRCAAASSSTALSR